MCDVDVCGVPCKKAKRRDYSSCCRQDGDFVKALGHCSWGEKRGKGGI